MRNGVLENLRCREFRLRRCLDAGSVLIWILGFFLLLGLAEGEQLNASILTGTETFVPIANGFVAGNDIQNRFAEFEASEWVAKNIAVANIPIGAEWFLAIDDCFYVFEGKSLPIGKAQGGKRVGFIGLKDDFIENHAISWAIVVRNFRQILATKTKRPPFQESGSIPVVLDRNFDLRELEKSPHVRSAYVSSFKFMDNQCWDRHSSSYIGTGFRGIGALYCGHSTLPRENCGSPEMSRLASHAYALAFDGREGVRTRFISLGGLNIHRVSLSLDGPKSAPKQIHLKGTNQNEQTTEQPITLVRPILRYRHGGKFADRYGLWVILACFCGAVVLLFCGLTRLSNRPLRWMLLPVLVG